MADGEIVPAAPVEIQTTVDTFSTGLQAYLTTLNLPAENVLVQIEERRRVINNLPAVVERLSPEQKTRAFYVSKFVAACGAGLFDAALNFLWDEVVSNLRNKVSQFDLGYFFDSAVTNPQERARYSSEEDLQEIEDWALIKGCHTCGIITDIGYRHLDYIREMRNWASAAHPNQNQLTGFQLVAWLETCIREVLAKPVEGPVVEVRRLLRNVREQTLGAADVQPITNSIQTLPSDLATALLRSAFGLYVDPRTDVRVKNNVVLIARAMWSQAPEDTKSEVGLKYSNYSVNGDVARRDSARQFLDAVGGLTYLPPTELALEIQDKSDSLLRVHRGWDNFYNEIPAARELRKRIPANGEIPVQANGTFVKSVVLCRMGRHSGVSRVARPYYDEMIGLFQDTQIRAFLRLLADIDISSRLQHANCAANFREIARSLRRTVNANLIAALDIIIGATDAQLPNLARDVRFQRALAAAG